MKIVNVLKWTVWAWLIFSFYDVYRIANAWTLLEGELGDSLLTSEIFWNFLVQLRLELLNISLLLVGLLLYYGMIENNKGKLVKKQ